MNFRLGCGFGRLAGLATLAAVALLPAGCTDEKPVRSCYVEVTALPLDTAFFCIVEEAPEGVRALEWAVPSMWSVGAVAPTRHSWSGRMSREGAVVRRAVAMRSSGRWGVLLRDTKRRARIVWGSAPDATATTREYAGQWKIDAGPLATQAAVSDADLERMGLPLAEVDAFREAIPGLARVEISGLPPEAVFFCVVADAQDGTVALDWSTWDLFKSANPVRPADDLSLAWSQEAVAKRDVVMVPASRLGVLVRDRGGRNRLIWAKGMPEIASDPDYVASWRTTVGSIDAGESVSDESLSRMGIPLEKLKAFVDADARRAAAAEAEKHRQVIPDD